MFNKISRICFSAFSVISLVMLNIACTPDAPSNLSGEALIPKPVSVVPAEGWFTLKPGTRITVREGSDELLKVGGFLADKLRPSTGYVLEVETVTERPGQGIFFELAEGGLPEAGNESYRIEISPRLVLVTSNTPEGAFRAVQTLRQLLPAKVEADSRQEGPWQIAAGEITDYPVYSYRGVMLDVARHFFSPEEVKILIDNLALYKINKLHLGLSNDQGWRIEIKSWPNLTIHGGSTEVGGGEGGFYTQEQYTDLVNYAAANYITVIPEIDMPGHTNAALASYAELNCNGKAPELYTGTEVGFSTLCTGKEITYKFIDDVVREISALTPGEYFHMGGDESHATSISDYIPFVTRVQEIVAAHGKKVIGWDEIALSALQPNTIAQFWASNKNASLAVGQGAKILMSPAKKAYMDMQYDRNTKLGLHWAAYIEVDSAYIWDPANYATGIGRDHIIGIEAALWTETISNIDEVEYMVFPRLPGYAEIGWTPAEARNWDEYKLRLAGQESRFKALGIDYYPSRLVPWETEGAEATEVK